MLLLTRRYGFSAAHQLWNPDMSEADNHRCFGPCARLHGHNYTLDVSVTGTIDPVTGMLCDITAMDSWIQCEILDHVDHQFLDKDVAFISGTLSTVENLAQCFYDRLEQHPPEGVTLARLRLYESPDNWTEITQL